MAIYKFGAIDVGSNAIRLLISNVIEDKGQVYYKKVALVRLPLRLGFDAFTQHEISDAKIDALLDAMQAYRYLLKVYEVIDYRACATSAMREATNAPAIIERISMETGINLEIIGGKEEAAILYATQITTELEAGKPYLYIDVGGGSTEISLFYDNEIRASKSFKVGTVRLLNNMVLSDTWKEMEKWVKQHCKKHEGLSAIGTGGNISKIFKINKLQKDEPMSLARIAKLHEELSRMSYEERIRKYDMKPDRADVILPAGEIYMQVMHWAKSPQIYVPKVGVADGIVKLLYEKNKNKN